jgi:hypothetical protein
MPFDTVEDHSHVDVQESASRRCRGSLQLTATPRTGLRSGQNNQRPARQSKAEGL